LADTHDDELGSFFERPIKTVAYSWNVGATLFASFNPWQDFFENKRVINRITNYNLLRCKLHVKFVLNGNSFHYGRAIASYTPLHNFDSFTKDRGFFIQDIVAASQRPHIYLDPTQSQGGTLDLPFVWEYNALNIPTQDWRDMGEIIIHGMQPLAHANGANDGVTVSIFVWASDVVLSVPTSNHPGALVPQSGDYDDDEHMFDAQADEYGQGIISKPAAIIARAAGALASIPGIGMYAKATQLAASAVSSIAATFGYSRPIVLTDILNIKPTIIGNMANSNTADTSTKLTLDAKQELCIDTRTFGLDGTDEMTLKSIATRESWLTNFQWDLSQTAETQLFTTEVNPFIWAELNQGTFTEYHLPACAYAALPFKHWRGTMKYRFQIVCSAFHKGRLKVTYDPSYPLSNEYNTNYTRIIDISEERDFTVEIGWGQQWPFLEHRNMFSSGVIYRGSTPLGGAPGKFANGIISVYVVNELTVPNTLTNNNIAVNVFVTAGDDIEFANPDDDHLQDLTWFQPQWGEYTYEAQSGDVLLESDDSAPISQGVDESMAAPLSSSDNTLDVFFGDPIVSFRQCLKRYGYVNTLFTQVTGAIFTTYTLSDFPMYMGRAPGAVHFVTTPVGSTYNFAKMTLLNYVTPAFTCRRGGLRWKYVLTGAHNSSSTSIMTAVRKPSSPFTYSSTSTFSKLPTATNSEATFHEVDLLPSMWAGGTVTSTMQNPVVEVEVPFQDAVRFAMAKQANVTSTLIRTYFHDLIVRWTPSTTAYTSVTSYVSTGEDFSLGFFTGAPVAYFRVPVVPT
jgi:hypothetical protein